MNHLIIFKFQDLFSKLLIISYQMYVQVESLLLTNLSKLDFSKQKYCHVSCLNDDNDKQKGHSKKIIKNLPHCEYK